MEFPYYPFDPIEILKGFWPVIVLALIGLGTIAVGVGFGVAWLVNHIQIV